MPTNKSRKITVGDLFSGIGGFSYGLERTGGFETKWFVESDPFCNKVLEKHWPGVKRYGDIKTVGNLESVDLVCGGFPCQPFSCAGKRGGQEDNRYLWPEMLRIISDVRPTWVIGENVAGIVNMALDQVCADLEGEGYEVRPFIIPACAVNAPHRRDRVWIVGYTEGERCGKEREHIRRSEEWPSGTSRHAPHSPLGQDDRGGCGDLEGQEGSREGGNAAVGVGNQSVADTPGGSQPPSDEIGAVRRGYTREDIGWSYIDATDTDKYRLSDGIRRDGSRKKEERASAGGSFKGCYPWGEPWPSVAARLCRVDARVPRRVDRLRALGNSVVPQIVEILGRMIISLDR